MDPQRLYRLNDRPVRPDGDFVLYWMTAARRLERNFGLQHAVGLARDLRKPLVILEALRCDYEHASDRIHAFVIEGMAEHAAALARGPAAYYPYVEPVAGAGRGLLRALADDACLVATDWYPAFFLPRMLAAAARQVRCRLDAIDSNGILPVASAGRAIPMAHGFRSHLQRSLRPHLAAWPERRPLAKLPRALRATLPPTVVSRWPMATPDALARQTLPSLPIDHAVAPVARVALMKQPFRGGARAARARLRWFVGHGLDRYAVDHSQPEADATSRLSPWLHFGHISAHEIFESVMTRERWTSRRLGTGARGGREGWWGTPADQPRRFSTSW